MSQADTVLNSLRGNSLVRTAAEIIEHLGRYAVVGRLGAGGMGEVLRVRDDDLGRELAAKVMRGQVDPARLEKFALEARITGQLEHPNIIPVHELGVSPDGRLFFTMKRVEGQTLSDVLSADRLPLSELLQMFLKISDAVAFAHSRGVIHRDLKPDNVMVGRFGELQVMDWGLSRVRDAECGMRNEEERTRGEDLDPGENAHRSATVEGTILGTPAYMPPEQALGKISELDERADVYSLGAILYEILTCQTPFTGGSTAAVLDKVIRGDLVVPSRRTPERTIPWELEVAVKKAMALRPEARYADVEALRADVASFLDGQTLAAASYSPWQILVKWAARHRAAVTATAAILLIGLASAVVAFVRIDLERRSAEAARDEAQSARHDAESARDEERRLRKVAVSERRQKEEQLQIAGINLARSMVWRARSLAGEKAFLDAGALLAAALEHAGIVEARAALLALPRSWVTLHRLLSVRGAQTLGVAFSPDSRSVATASTDGIVRIWEVATGRLRVRRFDAGVHLIRVAFSPDGKLLAAGAQDRAFLVRLRDGARMATLAGPGFSLSFSAGGRLLAAGGHASKKARVWAIPEGRQVREVDADLLGINSVALSPDGTILATGGGDSTVRLWKVSSGQRVLELHHQGPVRHLEYSPDGRLLVTASDDLHVRLWRSADGALLQVVSDPVAYHTAAWSPRGDLLALGGGSGGTRVRLWGVDEKRLLLALPRPSRSVESVVFSPDGRWLATAHRGGPVRTWRVHSRGPARVLKGTGGWVRAVRFGPGDRFLVTGDGEGNVSAWNLESGRQRRLARFEDSVNSLSFSADGGVLAAGSLDGTLALLEFPSGRTRLRVRAGAGVHAVAMAPDARIVAAGLDTAQALVVDAHSGKRLAVLGSHAAAVTAVAISSRGWAATGDRAGSVRLWSLPAGMPAGRLRASWALTSLEFSPDGALLALGQRGHDAGIFELATGKMRLLKHRSIVLSVAFSPGGRLLATGAWNHPTVLWGVVSAVRLATLRGTQTGIMSAAFARRGRMLAMGRVDATVEVWGLDTPWTSRKAQRLSGMELSGGELVEIAPERFARLVASLPGIPLPAWEK